MIILMGVSGCGKTTIGKLLAKKLGLRFVDADDYHPKSNIEKMKMGIPLVDKDRIPWLDQLAKKTKSTASQIVLACSALKEQYRERLNKEIPAIQWVYLEGSFELIKSRIDTREQHFMSSQLLKSQFLALEVPNYGIHVSIAKRPDEIAEELSKRHSLNKEKSSIGVFGLGVMGKSLSRNIASKEISISVYNRLDADEASVIHDFIIENKKLTNLRGFTDLEAFVKSLQTPRKIMLMIKAGSVIDEVIEKLQPLLDKGDIIIDGGNSHFEDTYRRVKGLLQEGIHFVGCGVSGGEKGALLGPSLMPGGSLYGVSQVQPILEKIAARDSKNIPCCQYIGPDGAGHFVKMVHNGIEYAEMQLISEVFCVLSKSMDYASISSEFSRWNNEGLGSYLLLITADILLKKERDQPLLDIILDKAGNKGTGSWSSKAALELGVPNTLMTSAVFARYISAFKKERVQLSKRNSKNSGFAKKIDIEVIKKAYQFSRVLNHHQGFQLLQTASETYDWDLNLSEIARIWTNGCIIKSELMIEIGKSLSIYRSILEDDIFYNDLIDTENDLREVLTQALEMRLALPVLSEGYQYWIGMTSPNSPANLIQAQRDYFGAHTYQRVDRPEDLSFHTEW